MADDQFTPEFITKVMEPMVEAFVAPTLMRMYGQCHPVKDHDSWCATHDSLWMPPEPVCRRTKDLQDTCERVLIAWEVRDGR